MQHDYDFLIVGGGMCADSAAKGIREQGADGSIGILGEERVAPFPRPALSKKLWTDPDFTRADAALDTEKETGADLLLATRVASVDPAAHQVTTEGGDTYGYGRLLIATGGHPRRIEGLDPSRRVFYFRTFEDYETLRMLAADKPDVVVVGGGYIGSEIAAALVQHGCAVQVLHPDEVLGQTKFPRDLAGTYEKMFTDAGVQVRGGVKVEGGSQTDDGVELRLDDGSSVSAQVVVVGLGIEPAGEVAGDTVRRADDGGIVVDERLRTSAEDVWAAGDVAHYPDAILGQRRIEHVDNATTMGTTVGRIMAGSDESYQHTPYFYSDLFDVGYEAVGTLDSSLETVQDPTEDGGLVVYYLDDDEVVGVLLWNCDGGLDAARELLARHDRPADLNQLVGTVRA